MSKETDSRKRYLALAQDADTSESVRKAWVTRKAHNGMMRKLCPDTTIEKMRSQALMTLGQRANQAKAAYEGAVGTPTEKNAHAAMVQAQLARDRAKAEYGEMQNEPVGEPVDAAAAFADKVDREAGAGAPGHYSFAHDESLEAHDKKYHGGKFDSETMTCGKREEMEKEDDKIGGSNFHKPTGVGEESFAERLLWAFNKFSKNVPDTGIKFNGNKVHVDFSKPLDDSTVLDAVNAIANPHMGNCIKPGGGEMISYVYVTNKSNVLGEMAKDGIKKVGNALEFEVDKEMMTPVPKGLQKKADELGVDLEDGITTIADLRGWAQAFGTMGDSETPDEQKEMYEDGATEYWELYKWCKKGSNV